jgi:hypothetical protein
VGRRGRSLGGGGATEERGRRARGRENPAVQVLAARPPLTLRHTTTTQPPTRQRASTGSLANAPGARQAPETRHTNDGAINPKRKRAASLPRSTHLLVTRELRPAAAQARTVGRRLSTRPNRPPKRTGSRPTACAHNSSCRHRRRRSCSTAARRGPNPAAAANPIEEPSQKPQECLPPPSCARSSSLPWPRP